MAWFSSEGWFDARRWRSGKGGSTSCCSPVAMVWSSSESWFDVRRRKSSEGGPHPAVRPWRWRGFRLKVGLTCADGNPVREAPHPAVHRWRWRGLRPKVGLTCADGNPVREAPRPAVHRFEWRDLRPDAGLTRAGGDPIWATPRRAVHLDGVILLCHDGALSASAPPARQWGKATQRRDEDGRAALPRTGSSSNTSTAIDVRPGGMAAFDQRRGDDDVRRAGQHTRCSRS